MNLDPSGNLLEPMTYGKIPWFYLNNGKDNIVKNLRVFTIYFPKYLIRHPCSVLKFLLEVDKQKIIIWIYMEMSY